MTNTHEVQASHGAMAADSTPIDLGPDAETRDLDGPSEGSRHRLAILFMVLLMLLGLLGATGTALGAVDALLANPAGSCGGG